MALFDENIQTQLRDIFTKLKDDVHILYFHQELECESCTEMKQFLTEISALSDKIKLEILNFSIDQDKAALYNINKIPGMVILDKDKNDFGIRFYGTPGGYEINSFIFALMELSGVAENYPDDVTEKIKAIDKPVHIQVFVTPSCPHCPGAVITGHKMAHLNPNITAEMIEANTFPDISLKYNVSGVPKIIINETNELLGNQPINEFLNVINKI